jgi:hypothetical protein
MGSPACAAATMRRKAYFAPDPLPEVRLELVCCHGRKRLDPAPPESSAGNLPAYARTRRP